MHRPLAILCMLASAAATHVAWAADVAAHPDPLSALGSADPSLAANKRLVFDMWRSVVNAGHIEAADQMVRANVGRLPVVTRADPKKVVGFITRSDLLKAHERRLAESGG